VPHDADLRVRTSREALGETDMPTPQPVRIERRVSFMSRIGAIRLSPAYPILTVARAREVR
jgi:hypothetical protein